MMDFKSSYIMNTYQHVDMYNMDRVNAINRREIYLHNLTCVRQHVEGFVNGHGIVKYLGCLNR